jgi:methyl-accepting chemotaxis protein
MRMFRFNNLKMLYKMTLISTLGVILFLAGTLFYILPKIESKIMLEKQLAAKNMVEMVISVLDGYAAREAAGKLGPASARAAAIEAVGGLRYADGNYFWITDLKPTMVLHPIKKELTGKDMDDFKDAHGKRLFSDSVKVCREHGSGFVSYMWPKPGKKKPVSKLSYVRLFKKWGWIVGTGIYVDDVAAQMFKLRINLMVFSTLVAFLVLSFAYISAKRISGQLNQAVLFTKKVAGGELSSSLAIHQQDETGVLSNALNRMASDLRDMIGRIADGVETVTASSTELSAISQQMAAGSEQSSGKSLHVASVVDEMGVNMQTVASASQHTSANWQAVASAAEHMTATNRQISSDTEKGRRIAGEAVDQASLTSTQVDDLGKAVQQIGKVTEAIAEISEQTNLLALNATIEAARAGEAGKGFAVVANEIKELAKQTADATKEIGEQISNIQLKTSDTVGKINQISTVIQDLSQIVTAVAAAMEEQSSATLEIANNVHQAARGIDEVNQNVARTADLSGTIARDMAEVNQAAHETANGSAQVSGSARELSALAEQLNQMITKFKI